jgi:hypothetical protein
MHAVPPGSQRARSLFLQAPGGRQDGGSAEDCGSATKQFGGRIRLARTAINRGVSSLAVLTFAALLGAVPGGCSRAPQPAPDRAHQESVLRRSVGGEPESLDPQRAGDTFSFEVLRDLFEGLTSESAAGEIVPGAAENW